MKESIDIEDLLVWAYRDMQADRISADRGWGQALRESSSWAQIEGVGRYGALIDPSRHELLPSDCDDAALIDRHVMALDVAFLASGADGETMVLDVAMIAAEGGTVEIGRGERAEMTTAAGETVPLRTITISPYLVIHARNATRPDCYADVSRRRGRPRKDGEVAAGVTWEDVIYHRAIYSVWHAALGLLAESLNGFLVRWAVSAPKAQESPWLVPAPRVLEVISRENSPAPKSMKSRRKTAA